MSTQNFTYIATQDGRGDLYPSPFAPKPHHAAASSSQQSWHFATAHNDSKEQGLLQSTGFNELVQQETEPDVIMSSASQVFGDNGNIEDDDAQSKRKAQNRAAQKAFRERREKHVKELEQKLEIAIKHTQEIELDNARLKKELQWFQAENHALKQSTSQSSQSSQSQSQAVTDKNRLEQLLVFPKFHDSSFAPDAFANQSAEFAPQYALATDDDESTVYLTPSEVWDRIQTHDKSDMINIDRVTKHIMPNARCGGNGPIFRIQDVDLAIQLTLAAI
ncbi:hypothetical protein V1514DRAFT_336992 [Lipomyces japonicus]|uniref:uncharacterized protein n=1 Tax=Lipomyces japonicus TaxID=56871 RepID=UPI0034CD82EA